MFTYTTIIRTVPDIFVIFCTLMPFGGLEIVRRKVRYIYDQQTCDNLRKSFKILWINRTQSISFALSGGKLYGSFKKIR